MHSGCRALGVCLLAVLPLAPPALAQGTELPYASYHPALVFDWYAPAAHATAANPCVVFMHGAQGFGGSKADVNVGSASILKQHLLANGCTVMAIDFRPFPEFLHPAQLEDGAAALQHFRAHAAQYSIDPDRLAVWGISGGAIIGGWLCYGPDLANPTGTAEQQISTRPQAFVNFSGLTNFLLMVPWWPGTMFGQPTLAQVDPAFLDSVSISEQVTDVARPFTPPVASSYGTNENPPPCVDPHDVTMMKDLHAHLAAHDPAVAAASLMVQNSIGVTLGNLGALAAWVLERFGSTAPIDVGGALAGSGGVAPALAASGSTAPGATLVLEAQASLAAPVTLWFVLGPTHLGAAFYGGTLVPAPAAVVPLPSDAAGHRTLSAPVPPGVPPGVVQYVQFWHADAAGPQGYAASNALRIEIAAP